jgi:hypothetical protein
MVKCEVKTSNGFILATAPATTTTAATATTTPTATNNKAGLSLPGSTMLLVSPQFMLLGYCYFFDENLALKRCLVLR